MILLENLPLTLFAFELEEQVGDPPKGSG